MENTNFEFRIDEKGIRRLGYEFGYGYKMGACRAMIVMGVCVSIAKALGKFAVKKMTITVEKDKEEAEEKAEE